MNEKKFRIVKPGTDEDVFGGAVEIGNVYITAYPKTSRPVAELEIGEHAEAEYRLSGTKGTYWIVRVA